MTDPVQNRTNSISNTQLAQVSSPAPAQHLQLARTPTQIDVDAAVERVLAAGKRERFGVDWLAGDNYDERTTQLARELAGGTPEFRQAVLQGVIARDPSVVDPQRINDLADRGQITQTQRSNMAEAYAGLYNDGRIPSYTVPVSPHLSPDDKGNQRVQSNLDGPVLRYHSTGSYDILENAGKAREFVDFINSSTGPEATQFKQDYAEHLIDQYVLNKAQVDPMQRDAAAGIATALLTDDRSRPEMLVNTLQPYSAADTQTILKHVQRSEGLLGERILNGLAQSRLQNGSAYALPDGLTAIYNSVSRVGGAKADEVAIDLATYAANNPSAFRGADGSLEDRRAEALAQTMVSHGNAILTRFSDRDTRADGSVEDPNAQAYHDNAQQLGTLFGLTLSNQNNANRQAVVDRVERYVAELGRQINANPNYGTEDVARIESMALIAASATDSIRQGFNDAKASLEQKKALVGTLIDIALAAVPYGKTASSAVEASLKELFGDSARVTSVLNSLSGKLIDTATGQVNDAAKKTLLDALGPDIGNLKLSEQQVNNFVRSTFEDSFRTDGENDNGRMLADFKQFHELTLLAIKK